MIHDIQWIDSGREPQCAPNPRYPEGIDLFDFFADDGRRACKVELPYPAKRCGFYRIECRICRRVVGCTTAGRPDDPRSITMACAIGGREQ